VAGLAALHLLRARATSTSKADFLRVGGVGPVEGDAVNPSMGAWSRHPCRSHPLNRTHPAFDSSPRSGGTASCTGGCRPLVGTASDPRFIWISDGCADQRSAPTNSRVNLSGAGRCGLAGPQAPWMAPTSPQGWVYGVSCQPTPPRPTHSKPEPPLILLRLRPRLEAGAGLQALPNPLPFLRM